MESLCAYCSGAYLHILVFTWFYYFLTRLFCHENMLKLTSMVHHRGMSHVIYFIPPPSFWCNFVPYRRYSEIWGYPIFEPPEKIQYWSLRLMNDTNDPELISELKWPTSSIIWGIKAILDSLNPRTIFLALVLYVWWN